MNYNQISKETFDYLYKSRASLNASPLDKLIRILVEICVSKMNHCTYCCHLHTDEAIKLGVPREKIDALPNWNTSTLFDEKEKLAFKWAESVTRLAKNLGYAREQMMQIFTEKEIVDLTACVAIMNALNRIAISLRA